MLKMRRLIERRPTEILIPAVILIALIAPSANAADSGETYVDGSYGFSLRPPRGWELIRERRAEPPGLIILQMVHRAGPALVDTIAVRTALTDHPRSPEDMLADITSSLTKELKEPRIITRQTRRIGDRDGGSLVATFKQDGATACLMATIVRARPRQYYMLMYSGPDARRGEIEPMFDSVVQSFRVLEDETTDRAMRKALLSGTDWLKSLTARRLEQLPVGDTYQQIFQDGEPVGFLKTTTEQTSYGGRRGAALRELGWTFPSDGTQWRVQNEMFVSGDLRAERWRSTTTTYYPAGKGRPATLDATVFEGVREYDQLVTSQLRGYATAAESNPPLTTPTTYVSRALVRLLPLLIDDWTRPRMMALNEYDHDCRGLVTRTFAVEGDMEIPGSGGKRAIRIRQREGFSGEPSDVYVDRSGRVMAILSGKTALRAAPKSELDHRFGRRVQEGEKLIRGLEEDYKRLENRFGDPHGDEGKPPKK